ncbi:hypothetical protein KQI82_11615 [Oscillibacter sp. MSJ-2]|uniref:DUF4367 domain-containing protein n=1 Tax=Dysosmobacter acutus TaxID=2841504 RepID=A0ABS6FB93_9FIRM|nr:hypothetical protein [Dysosmobacter acutus]MBU5627558.1 hypothetical protein [Dysosmobacter acutus]
MREAACKKLFDSLTNVSETWIEEAQEPFTKKRRWILNRWGAAACLCLLIATATAFAVSGPGTALIEWFTSRAEPGSDFTESGFDLSVELERVPISDLTGEVRNAGALIAQQFKDYRPYDSWFPGLYQIRFSSPEEAYDYIGLSSLKQLDWDLEEQETTLNVCGTPDGRITSINLETMYLSEEIRLQFHSRIYTEFCDEPLTIGVRTTESVGYQESFYTTASARRCHIITSSALKSGYLCLDGYLVDGGVLYSLHLAYLEEDSDWAEELLRQWADQF